MNMQKPANTSTRTSSILHATPRVIDNISMPWPVHDLDLARIKAQIKRNPGNAWPSRIAMEWDLTEGVARSIIKESLRG